MTLSKYRDKSQDDLSKENITHDIDVIKTTRALILFPMKYLTYILLSKL
jgi:hypothetical protein